MPKNPFEEWLESPNGMAVTATEKKVMRAAWDAALRWVATVPTADPITDVGDWNLLRAKLTELIRPEDLDVWMGKSNPVFGGKTPTQLLQDGEAHQLWDMAYRLESGEPI